MKIQTGAALLCFGVFLGLLSTHLPAQNKGQKAREAIPDLIAWYPFSGDAKDASGNGYDGRIQGAKLTKDRFGRPDKAYHFDGKNDRIDFPLPNVGHPDGHVTWSGWFRTDQRYDITHYFLVSTGACGMAIRKNRVFYSMEIGRADYKNVSSDTGYCDNQWHFAAMTYDNEYLRGYIDGELVGKVLDGSGKIDYDAVLGYTAGHSGTAERWFKGDIDDIRVYERALSTKEISLLWSERPGKGRKGRKQTRTSAPGPENGAEILIEQFREAGMLSVEVRLPSAAPIAIEISNEKGKVLHRSSTEGCPFYKSELDISAYQKGTYVLVVKAGDQMVSNRVIRK